VTSAGARSLPTLEVTEVGGAVVVVDVIRAFTTAAAAFEAGAEAVDLVGTVEEALALKAAHPGWWAMGEDRGLRPDGFDLPNSPVLAATADLAGRTLVQSTSAGTQGVVAAQRAERLWCTGLATASATARAVNAAGLGAPTYVITGWLPDRPDRPGTDDLLTARHIEAIRTGAAGPDAHDQVARAVAASDEAARTLQLGSGHVHPDDIAFAADVDRAGFAMEVRRDDTGLRLERTAA